MSAVEAVLEETPGQQHQDRRSKRSASDRASTLRRLAVVWLFGAAAMAAVALQTSVPAADLLLDAAVVGGGHWYSGMITSIGIVIWTVAAAAAFGAAHVSRLLGRARASMTMLAAGGLIALLLLDDLFLLHSSVVPRMLGGPKLTLLAIEAAFAVGWIVSCWSEIVRTRWELLVAAGIGFAGSIVVDQGPWAEGVGRLILEDGAKLLGILALAAWSVSTSADLARSGLRPAR